MFVALEHYDAIKLVQVSAGDGDGGSVCGDGDGGSDHGDGDGDGGSDCGDGDSCAGGASCRLASHLTLVPSHSDHPLQSGHSQQSPEGVPPPLSCCSQHGNLTTPPRGKTNRRSPQIAFSPSS